MDSYKLDPKFLQSIGINSVPELKAWLLKNLRREGRDWTPAKEERFQELVKPLLDILPEGGTFDDLPYVDPEVERQERLKALKEECKTKLEERPRNLFVKQRINRELGRQPRDIEKAVWKYLMETCAWAFESKKLVVGPDGERQTFVHWKDLDDDEEFELAQVKKDGDKIEDMSTKGAQAPAVVGDGIVAGGGCQSGAGLDKKVNESEAEWRYSSG